MKKRLLPVLLALMLVVVILPPVVYASPDIETLRPNATGSETEIVFQVPASGAHWEKVDEEVADDDTTYVRTAALQRDLYNLPASAGSGVINKITLYFRAKGGAWWSYVRGAIKSDSTVTETSSRYPATDFGIGIWGTYTQEWAINPADSEAWEWADIDDLEIGAKLYGDGGDLVGLTQVYIEVDYTPLTAPTITTLDASNIAADTARLNAVLTDDGADSCNVSFAYHHNTASDNWTSADNTTWVAGYNSGSYPYADITELLYNTKYYFHARARNTIDSVNGSILSFTTESGINIPTNFKAFPETNSVALSWTKGAGTGTTMVRHKVGSYSINITDGTLVYLGPLNSCEHTGLDSGTTGFYSAFGASGDNYTDTYAMVLATTSGSPVAVAPPDAPSEPTGWFQATDYTQFSAFPLYPFLNDFADAIPLPRNTFWFLLAIGLCLFVGIFIGVKSKSGTAGMIVMAASVGLLSGVALLPRFMFAFVVLFLIGAWQMRHQGGGMSRI